MAKPKMSKTDFYRKQRLETDSRAAEGDTRAKEQQAKIYGKLKRPRPQATDPERFNRPIEKFGNAAALASMVMPSRMGVGLAEAGVKALGRGSTALGAGQKALSVGQKALPAAQRALSGGKTVAKATGNVIRKAPTKTVRATVTKDAGRRTVSKSDKGLYRSTSNPKPPMKNVTPGVKSTKGMRDAAKRISEKVAAQKGRRVKK